MTNRFCPVCLNPTDENGDHWQGCEYEATFNGKPNPVQPLDELGMLKRLLSDSIEQRNRYDRLAANQRNRINALKETINKLELPK